MNSFDYTTINHKRYSDYQKKDDEKLIKYLKNLITRCLLAIILVISTCIFAKINSQNKLLVKEYVFKDSLKFTEFNNWYQKNFGKIIPDIINKNNSDMVMSSSELIKNKYEKYLDGVKISVSKKTPISILYGGIVVFVGEKDNYGNVVIIQGNDGIDYWYGGISNTNINLYDYLEKDTLIGEATNDYIYLVLEKDNSYLNYEEYLQ